MVGRSSTEGGWGVAYHLSFLDTCFHMWALTCVISHVCPYVRSHMCSHCVLSCVCSHQGVCVCVCVCVSTLIPVLSSMCVCACAHAFPCACSHRYIPICFFFCVCSLIPVLSIFVISHVCVCVSHSVSKSFYTQGGGARWGVSGQRRHPPPGCKRTCDQLLSKLFYSLVFAFMVVFMIRPQNQVSMHGINSVC